MPTYYGKVNDSHDQTEHADVFPKLLLKMCPGDDGERPSPICTPRSPDWGPKWAFHPPDLRTHGAEHAVSIEIHNTGTVAAEQVVLEFALNQYLGNEREGMEWIDRRRIPHIPAGQSITSPVIWVSDPTKFPVSLNARVFDTYSLVTSPTSLDTNWLVNPQAAFMSVMPVFPVRPDRTSEIYFLARNFSDAEVLARAWLRRAEEVTPESVLNLWHPDFEPPRPSSSESRRWGLKPSRQHPFGTSFLELSLGRNETTAVPARFHGRSRVDRFILSYQVKGAPIVHHEINFREPY